MLEFQMFFFKSVNYRITFHCAHYEKAVTDFNAVIYRIQNCMKRRCCETTRLRKINRFKTAWIIVFTPQCANTPVYILLSNETPLSMLKRDGAIESRKVVPF